MAKETLMETLSLNLPAMAQIIKKKGRGKDTVLAHITPEEAKLLKKRGGRGSINPDTGLLEFENFYSGEYMGAPDYSAAAAPTVQYEPSGGGYTYTPQEQQYFTDIGVPTYSGGEGISQPIDFSQYTGAPGITQYAEAPGVQFTPQQQAGFATGAIPAPTGLEPVVDVSTPTTAAPQQSVLDRLSSITGLNKDQLAKLGLSAGLGLTGVMSTKKAAAQGQQARKDLETIAAPYRTQGQELVRQAQAGELTPQSQQAYQAARAQLAQGIEQRGGVGAAQAATQLESLRQNLLNNQYQTGLQILGIGDNIAVGAIRTGMEADRYVNQLTQSYFTNIARVMSGSPLGLTQQTIYSGYPQQAPTY